MSKIDIKLTKDEFYDISFAPDGDLATVDGLNTAIDMSLLEQRRALPSEVPVSTRRRGWWGNQFAERTGFEIGSKLWLFEQERLTSDILSKIREAANDGLSWLVERDIAVDVNSDIKVESGVVKLTVTLTRPNGQVERRYFDLWDKT